MWRTFTARGPYCNPIPWFEKLSLGDRVVDFRFEDVEETFFADLLAGFGTLEDCTGFGAESAQFGSHGSLLASGWLRGKLDRTEEERLVRVMTRSAGKALISRTAG